MKKQMMSLALAGAIGMSAWMGTFQHADAQDLKKELPMQNPNIKEIRKDEVKKESFYIAKNVKIAEITKKGERYLIRAQEKNGEILFDADANLFVFDHVQNVQKKVEDLKKEDEIAVIIAKNAPMMTSLPPRIAQIKAIIVKEDAQELKVSVIDEGLRESNQEFIITKNDQMKVFHVNEPDKALTQEALKGAEAIILYRVATFSLPPQVKVDAAIVMRTMEEIRNEEIEAEELITPVKEEPSYVPLRKSAEEKGYKVTWQGKKQPILLEKNDIRAEISLDSKAFTYTHMTRDLQPLDMIKELDLAPFLDDKTTMVSDQFIKMLK